MVTKLFFLESPLPYFIDTYYKAPCKRGNIVAETLFPRMFIVRVIVRETMFPCQVNQETFQWKQTFAHAHFRKYSPRDHRIQSTLFPRSVNGVTFFAETICFWKNEKNVLFLGNKKCFRNKCFVRAQLTGKHLGKHASSTMFPQQCFVVSMLLWIAGHLLFKSYYKFSFSFNCPVT